MTNARLINTEFLEYLWPMRHYLITCGDMDLGSNIIAVSFCMPVSRIPPMICCAIGTGAYSASLISSAGEFIVNVPTEKLRGPINYCGYHTGREVDKFMKTGLTKRPARKVAAPAIGECVAFMECILKQVVPAGNKLLFIGEVVEAYADEKLKNGELKEEFARGSFPRKIYGTRFKNSEKNK